LACHRHRHRADRHPGRCPLPACRQAGLSRSIGPRRDRSRHRAFRRLEHLAPAAGFRRQDRQCATMRASETALAHRRRGDAVRPVLILVALRPLIDLAGESSGGALAPGGLYALAVAALVLWQLVASRGEAWVPFFAAVLSLTLFVVADLHRPL